MNEQDLALDNLQVLIYLQKQSTNFLFEFLRFKNIFSTGIRWWL